mgnify:CR=1 FL=1
MRRAGKYLLRSTAAIIALAVLLLALVVLVLNTESGTRWALNRISNAAPGELVLGEFDGTLWRGLTFDAVSYSDDGQEIVATDLNVSLNWSMLTAGHLPFETVSATMFTRTSLATAPEMPEPLEVSMPVLPIRISVAGGAIEQFNLVSETSKFQVDNIRFNNARLSGNTIRAKQLVGGFDALQAQIADFSITLGGDVPIAARLAWQLEDAAMSGSGKVQGSLAEMSFEQRVAGEYAGDAAGVVRLLNRVEPEIDATVTWERWVFGEQELLNCETKVKGLVEDYDAEYSVTLVVPGQEPLQISGSASGSTRELRAFRALVSSPEIEAELAGQLAWEPAFSASATVDATGMLNGAALDAKGEVIVSANEQRCTACVVSIGDNELRIDGALAASGVSLNYSLDAPVLAQILPDLGGAAVANGKVTGTLEQPRLTSTAELRSVVYKESKLGDLNVVAQGAADNLDITADWVYESLAVNVEGQVGIAEGVISGNVQRASVREERAGEWSLAEPFGFSVDGQDIRVDAHDWDGDNGDVSVTRLSMQGDDVQIIAALQEMPLQLGAAFLPSNFELLGHANANVDIVRRDGNWSGPVNWRQVNTVLRVRETNDEFTDVAIPRAEIDALLADGGMTAQARLEIEPGVLGELDMTLQQLAPDAAMNASLRLQGDDWSWISAVVPQIDRFGGSVGASITADGPLNAPAFAGDLEWHEGSLTVPALNVPINNIEVVVSGASDGDAKIAGSARAGDGTLTIDGLLQNVMQTSRAVRLSLGGLDAELVNWPEYRIWGSPDLELVGDADGWRFSGELTVPRADIAVREVPVSAVTESPDVVVLGEETEEDRQTPITGKAKLILGDKVQFKAFGLDTRLTGDLTVSLLEGKPLSTEGRVTLVDGTFIAQGQRLSIERGQLTFTGPLDDPLIDVRAVRVIEGFEQTVTAGIHVRGRAQNLTSSVYSDPSMSDADALSYLVIGRPLSQATATEGGELSGAAVALGLRQATRITDQIGQALGLDELAISGDGSDGTALVAGKQINSRLYARYAYGVFSRLGTLLLRYRLSRAVTLEAGAGENQSIDVLYSIEK